MKMIDNLIKTGKELEKQVKPDELGRKSLSGVEFEKWAASTILFLENKFLKSSITEKAIQKNKNLDNDSYGNYEFLLGTLLAAKDMIEEQRKEDKAQADFFRQLNS